MPSHTHNGRANGNRPVTQQGAAGPWACDLIPGCERILIDPNAYGPDAAELSERMQAIHLRLYSRL